MQSRKYGKLVTVKANEKTFAELDTLVKDALNADKQNEITYIAISFADIKNNILADNCTPIIATSAFASDELYENIHFPRTIDFEREDMVTYDVIYLYKKGVSV